MDLTNPNKRDVALDAIAGLFIIIMMFQHYNIVTRAPLTIGHLFMFNTTWFFFKSGMFHRPVKLNGHTMSKLIKRLLIPFVFCSFFGVLLSFICYWLLSGEPDIKLFFGIFGQIIIYGAPWWNIPVWFLLTLFLVKIITSGYNGRYTMVYLLIVMVVFIVHNIISHSDRFNYIGNTALATFVYILGFKLKELDFNRYMLYWLIGAIFLIIFFIFPSALDIWANKALYGNYFLAVFSAILGIILVNKIFKLCKFLHIKPLVFMGQNAMLFLIFHVPFYLSFLEIFRNSGMSPNELNWGGAAFSIIGCFCVYLFFEHNKNLKWIIGE